MNLYKNTYLRTIMVSLAMLCAVGNVNAAPVSVSFTLQGNVDSAEAGNIFGLAIGDTISATGSFDHSLLTGGTGAITDLVLTVGSQTFDNSMEVFGGGAISLSVLGELTDLTYEANEGNAGATADFDSFFTSFTGSALNGPKVKGKVTALTIAGTWDTTTFVAAVPVPAAVWLFGSGLLGLAGFARKKRA